MLERPPPSVPSIRSHPAGPAERRRHHAGLGEMGPLGVSVDVRRRGQQPGSKGGGRGAADVRGGQLQGAGRGVPGFRVPQHPVRPHLDAGQELLQVWRESGDLDVVVVLGVPLGLSHGCRKGGGAGQKGPPGLPRRTRESPAQGLPKAALARTQGASCAPPPQPHSRCLFSPPR